jgi:signal transduction histidine kinase/CheY-like chemotaxis protein
VGRDIGFYASESAPLIEEAFRKAVETGEPYDIELEFIRADGGRLWVRTIGRAETENGRVIRVVGNIMDITERKRLEEERQRMGKLESIGVLAGGIAHDFNNILTAILGNINLARLETKQESELYDRLIEAEKASIRARGLTQQLLTFAKGGAPVKKIASILELARDTASFSLRGSNVRCEFYISDELWQVEIDEGQISQVISNLVINAQQAMPAGGTIEVHIENMNLTEKQRLGRSLPLKKGNYVRIAVADHGIGIPADYLDKIFDPYFTTKQGGSGLGLAIAYSIVRNHAGHISIESKVGTGSTFYVYLPASKEKVLHKKVEKKELPVGRGRILVMDDEEAVRDIAGRMLRHIGYEDIGFATDGAEAIRLYKSAMASGKPFDAVILDLTIPGGMGGKETMKELLKIDPDVKAIVSSGYADESVASEFKEYGFRGVVAKPYTLEQLSSTLSEVVGEIEGKDN